MKVERYKGQYGENSIDSYAKDINLDQGRSVVHLNFLNSSARSTKKSVWIGIRGVDVEKTSFSAFGWVPAEDAEMIALLLLESVRNAKSKEG